MQTADVDVELNLDIDLVFLKFELYLHQNLDLNLDSNKLDLGLGLALARGPTRGAPQRVITLYEAPASLAISKKSGKLLQIDLTQMNFPDLPSPSRAVS